MSYEHGYPPMRFPLSAPSSRVQSSDLRVRLAHAGTQRRTTAASAKELTTQVAEPSSPSSQPRQATRAGCLLGSPIPLAPGVFEAKQTRSLFVVTATARSQLAYLVACRAPQSARNSAMYPESLLTHRLAIPSRFAEPRELRHRRSYPSGSVHAPDLIVCQHRTWLTTRFCPCFSLDGCVRVSRIGSFINDVQRCTELSWSVRPRARDARNNDSTGPSRSTKPCTESCVYTHTHPNP